MEELLHPEWSAEKIEQLKGHYQSILSLLGEDVEREGLLKTPERVAKAMLTLTRGYAGAVWGPFCWELNSKKSIVRWLS